MRDLWLWALPLLVVGDPPAGWSYDRNMSWDQVTNFTQWINSTWWDPSSPNVANIQAPITRSQTSLMLKVLYDTAPTPSSTANFSSAYVVTYFTINEPCCVTVDANLNSVLSSGDTADPAEFIVDYSVAGLQGWPFRNLLWFPMTSHQQFQVEPPANASGWFIFRVEFGINPFSGQFPAGSGSSVELTNVAISLGTCVDFDEAAVLYGLIGTFAFLFILLIILLTRLHKRKKGGRYNVPLATWWHLLDLATDLLFAFSMNLRSFYVACALSLFFTALPLVLHTLMGIYLFVREMRLQAFASWYSSNRCACNVLLGLMPILGSHSMTLLGSKLGGYIPLSAPFSDKGAYLIGMGTLITTMLEDIPQICIQVTSSISAKELSSIVILSVTVSLLTVLFRIVRMVFDSFHYWGKQGLPKTEEGGVTAFSGQPDPKTGAKWGDWLELWDDSSQMWYYENLVTGQTTWDKPFGWVDEPAVADKTVRRCYERRRWQWPITMAFTFFSLGMVVRYVMDPQNFQ